MSSCVGFSYGQNTDLLPLYDKYKRKDSVNDSLNIACNFGKWSIHSIECTGEQVSNRKSLRPDKKACEKCFNFPSIDKVRWRIRRMHRNLAIENYLMETKSSDTGFFDIRKFMKSNIMDASPSALKLRERCQQYISHHQWLKDHFPKLREYDVVDDSGKIYMTNGYLN